MKAVTNGMGRAAWRGVAGRSAASLGWAGTEPFTAETCGGNKFSSSDILLRMCLKESGGRGGVGGGGRLLAHLLPQGMRERKRRLSAGGIQSEENYCSAHRASKVGDVRGACRRGAATTSSSCHVSKCFRLASWLGWQNRMET